MQPTKRRDAEQREPGHQAQLNPKALSELTTKIDKGLNNAATKLRNGSKRKQPSGLTSSSLDVPRKKKTRGPPSEDSMDAPTGDDNTRLSEGALLQEILALGGDEEDLALIDNVESDSETDLQGLSDAVVDQKLQSELASFAEQLGLKNFRPTVSSKKLDDLGTETDAKADTESNSTPLVRQKGRNTLAREQFKLEPRADWHATNLASLPLPLSVETDSVPLAVLESLKAYSKTLLEADAVLYSKSILASSSHKFLSTIVTSGTLSDKVSALTLAIQESPVHNIKAFDTLLNLASKRSRGQAIGALGALVDLLGPGLILPSNRRLRAFHSQPELLGALQQDAPQGWSPGNRLPGQITEAHLLLWIYEDWLKNAYFRVIQLLEVWCSDEIEYSRTRSLDFVFGLLKDKPEQETNLLRLLVNKLGDKDRKIASRVSYLLLQLQTAHPGMKQVIINAVEHEVLLRQGQGFRAKYYAVNTLNQTILSSRDLETAESLLRIYFGMFVSLLTGQGIGRPPVDEIDQTQPTTSQQLTASKSQSTSAEKEVVEKIISAILTGINRAVPFIAVNNSILESQMDTLFRIAHSTNFNTSIQALILIQQVSASRHIASDRFYRTLYESLLDPRLVTSSKQALYLNLLLRALKGDVDSRRVKAFVKRMLQTINLHQPPFICGIFYVVSQLQLQYPDLNALLYEPEDLDSTDDRSWQAVDEKRNAAGLGGQTAQTKGVAVYDGRKRDPEHSNAHHSCLWEIVPSLTHFHPSVSLFAMGLLLDQEASHKPELESHTLIRFLDKFVYRNPKATETSRGASIMQPVRELSGSSSTWLGSKSASMTSGAVNSPAFWNMKQEQVAANDVFFHEYFRQSRKPGQATASKPELPDGPSHEDEIWKALTSSHPDGPIDSGSGSDFAMDDFDYDSDGLIAELGMDNESDMSLEEIIDQESESDDLGDNGDDEERLLGRPRFFPSEDRVASSLNVEADRKSSRKRARDLPTFASADDYADLLAGEEDGGPDTD